jgi:hypothetical protein
MLAYEEVVRTPLRRQKVNRIAWGLVAVLAVATVGGTGLLAARLRPYWVAKYRAEFADLRGAVLPGASLVGADLNEADLRGANLCYANLSAATLFATKLTGARLVGATLRGADLQRTDLEQADLRGADLQDAYLGGTNLTGADLRGANLDVASLEEPSGYFGGPIPDPITAKLTGARYDARTRWLQDFDPQKYGAVLISPSR